MQMLFLLWSSSYVLSLFLQTSWGLPVKQLSTKQQMSQLGQKEEKGPPSTNRTGAPWEQKKEDEISHPQMQKSEESCEAWKIVSSKCATGFVRLYYEDLGRQDSQAALAKWANPSNKVRQMLSPAALSSVQSLRIQNIQLAPYDSSTTWVEVDVTITTPQETRLWAVKVALKPIGGEWKILAIPER